MEKKNASEKELGNLHGVLAQELADRIKDGEKEIVFTEDDEGNVIENVVRKPAPSAILNVARQFLKDNNIEATRDNEQIKELVDGLPFEEEEDTQSVKEYN